MTPPFSITALLSLTSFLFAEVFARQLDVGAAARTLNLERWARRGWRNARIR